MLSDPAFLSRLQFTLTVSFHILFPAITIGLAVWNALLEGLHYFTGKEVYQRLFHLWLKIFSVLFVMGVVSGIVMAFQFGTNWSAFSIRTGPLSGALLGYEAFTAFLLEATFLGIVLYGRGRVSPLFYFLSTCIIAFGAVLSSFWILCNNSWMQVPVGYQIVQGRLIITDWAAVVFNQVFLFRWLHMLIASFLTSALCLAATGAWYALHRLHPEESRIMTGWGLGVTAVLIIVQIVVGDISGKHLYIHQPAKFAAIEARWHPEQPGELVLFGVPDRENRRNLFAVKAPYLGSWLATGSWTAPVSGLSDFPEKDWPPVAPTFFSFRIMFGLGMLMLAMSCFGLWLKKRGRLEETRWFLRTLVPAFPVGFAAVLFGWYTAEIGRQPWAVYGLLRTADSMTPSLTAGHLLFTILCYLIIYMLIFLSGMHYVYGMLREGPSAAGEEPSAASGAAAGPVSD